MEKDLDALARTIQGLDSLHASTSVFGAASPATTLGAFSSGRERESADL
jgi:hypothetical protein